MSVNSAFGLLGILTALFIRIVLQSANKKLELGQSTVAEALKGEAEVGIAGLTEEERVARKEAFRFIT